MFGKEKGRENEVQPVVNKPVSKDVKTIIGEGCKVEGSFFVPTTTRIDGTIKGDLTGENGIVIGSQGKIEGNINAPEVVVYGNVKGNIDSDKLELKRGSSVTGDISMKSFITEQGANFNGKCKMKVQSSEVLQEVEENDGEVVKTSE